MILFPEDQAFITYRRKGKKVPNSESGDDSDTMGDRRHEDDSTRHILNDLARGQQELVHLMTQLLSRGTGKGDVGGSSSPNGHGGRQGEAMHSPSSSHRAAGSRTTPRPLLPQFVNRQATEPVEQTEGFSDYVREYQALGAEFQDMMSLADFCTIKYRNRP